MSALAELGFRRFVVEKPLADGPEALTELLELADRRALDVLPVAHWRTSLLADRLADLVKQGALGALRSLEFHQSKPRFTKTAAGDAHPSAFEVEVPHSLGLALRLAGPAAVALASCSDLDTGRAVYPGMGGARLVLRHDTGVRTSITTDLSSPVRERRVVAAFDGGTATGHFPVSAEDHYAQLAVRGPAFSPLPSVFEDNALVDFVERAYSHFDGTAPLRGELAAGAAVVALIDGAKRLAGVGGLAAEAGR